MVSRPPPRSARARRATSSVCSGWQRPKRPLRDVAGRRGGTRRLLLDGFEEAQECRMLAEQILDLHDAGACPILDPRFAEVVLDVMKAAMVHSHHDRPG